MRMLIAILLMLFVIPFVKADTEFIGDALDYEGNCLISSLAFTNPSQTNSSGGVLDMTCKIRYADTGSCTYPSIYWIYQNETGWFQIPNTETFDIDCNGDTCVQLSPIFAQEYTRQIRGVDDGSYSVACWARDGDDNRWQINGTFAWGDLNVDLEFPLNLYGQTSSDINLTCSAENQAYGVANISLYNDISGTFQLNETRYNGYPNDSDSSFIVHYNGDNASVNGDISISPTIETYIDSPLGQAINLSLPTQYTNYSNLQISNWTKGTITFWATPNVDYGATSRFQFVDNNVASSEGMYFAHVAGNNQWFLYESGNSNNVLAASNVDLNAGTWDMLTFVWNETEQFIYFNGVLKSSKVHGQSPDISTSRGYFLISTGSSTLGCDCFMDEFKYFNRDLDAAEVMDLYILSTQNETFSFEGLDENAYKWSCQASSMLDNSTLHIGNNTFYIDNTAPIFSIIYPENKSYNLNIIPFLHHFEDISPDSCWYSLNGAANLTYGCETNITIIPANGDNNLKAYMNDSVGFIAEDEVNFANTRIPETEWQFSTLFLFVGGGILFLILGNSIKPIQFFQKKKIDISPLFYIAGISAFMIAINVLGTLADIADAAIPYIGIVTSIAIWLGYSFIAFLVLKFIIDLTKLFKEVDNAKKAW